MNEYLNKSNKIIRNHAHYCHAGISHMSMLNVLHGKGVTITSGKYGYLIVGYDFNSSPKSKNIINHASTQKNLICTEKRHSSESYFEHEDSLLYATSRIR